MLEVDIPSVFINLNTLMEDYLDEPAQKERKALVNKIISDIEDILKRQNPITPTDADNASELENYLYDHLNRSYMLVIALLRPNLYDLFKLPFLKEYWDELLINLSPPTFEKNEEKMEEEIGVVPASQYIPYPHIHSLDILISNFLLNQHHKVTETRGASFIKAMSFLAYAAAYGSLPAIEKAVCELFTHLQNPKDSVYRLEFIGFFQQLLDEAAKTYFHLGIRLRSVFLIALNENESSLSAKELCRASKKNLLLVFKLEEYINKIQEEPNLKLPEGNNQRLFSVPNKKLPDNPDLLEKFNIITNNAYLDGYYQRTLQDTKQRRWFETISPWIDEDMDELLNEENASLIDDAVRQVFNSPSLLIDILNDHQTPIHNFKKISATYKK